MEGAAIGIMAAADFAETFRAARKASLASLADGNRSEGSGATIRPMN
jgi:hypothetical protein